MKSLYNYYRPQNFDQVIGQDIVKTILKNSILNNKINHAYLFYGIRGTGKTTLARIFAKALNCKQKMNYNPCNHCNSCNEISQNNSFDVIEIDAASHNSVEKIREINEKSNYSTTTRDYKVYIIDEIHMLSKSAFNALLKTLEEPPKNTIFLLATTEINKIPETVLSRTIILNLEILSIDNITYKIKDILGLEKTPYEENAIKYISILSGGSLRDAISYLETIILYSDNFTEENVIKVLGLIKITDIDEIINNKISISKILENYSLNYKNVLTIFITHLTNSIDTLTVQQRVVLEKLIQLSVNIKDNYLIKIYLQNLFVNVDNKYIKEEEIVKKFEKIIEPIKSEIIVNKKKSISQEKDIIKNTKLLISDNYLTIIDNDSKKFLNKYSNSLKLLESFSNKDIFIKYINIFLDSNIVYGMKDAIILNLNSQKEYNQFKEFLFESNFKKFKLELFDNNIIILPIMKKQLIQINALYKKVKNDKTKKINKKINVYNEEMENYKNIFGEKLRII